MQISEVMNFLNEVAIKFPKAISLASGRPNPAFFSPEKWDCYRKKFYNYYSNERKISLDDTSMTLCQYGPAKGIINSLLSTHLDVDESIEVSAENIIVTNGCQEALLLICLHELKSNSDCILTIDPSYIGLSALVMAMSKVVEPVSFNFISKINEKGELSFSWEYLNEKVMSLKGKGLNPKALYVNPDFNNPLAYRLSTKERKDLISVCKKLGLKIVEDNPYSRFSFDGHRLPSLKSLDSENIVYHIGSFSKTFCPSVRIGYLVIPESSNMDFESLTSIKSLVSVNTASIPQAIIGGFLLDNKYSLTRHMDILNEGYLRQRDCLLKALNEYCKLDGVSWNMPYGGFFATVDLPFDITSSDVFECAKEFGVIFMPVSFFSLEPLRWSRKVRLAFSYYEPEIIEEAVKRFSRFVNKKLDSRFSLE